MNKLGKRELVRLERGLDVTQIRTLCDWGLSNEKIAYVMQVPVIVINNIMKKHNIIESL